MLRTKNTQLPSTSTPLAVKPEKLTNPHVSSHPPLPRPRAHSNFLITNVYKIKALFRRALCTIKECTLDKKARAQKTLNIRGSIHDLITKKYGLMNWPSQLNAVCRKAEDHAIDVPSAVYDALGKLSPVQLTEVLNLASSGSALKWLANLIDKLTASRLELQQELDKGLGLSNKAFKNATELVAADQETLWKAVIEKCESAVILQSDLKEAVKTAMKKATLGQLASFVEFCSSKTNLNANFISILKGEALKELKSRGKPLFHSAWLDLNEKERKCLGNLIKREDEFKDWKDGYKSEVVIARLMKKSDDEIIELLKNQKKISPELRCVARLRMNRLRDKGVNALNRGVITRTGSLKSPCHLIPALLILNENIRKIHSYEECIDEDISLRLNGAFSEVEPEDREIALGCLKYAVSKLKENGKNLEGEVVEFCSAGAAASCDEGDIDSLDLSIDRIFENPGDLENNKVPRVEIGQEIISNLTTQINKEIKGTLASAPLAELDDGVSTQFKNDLRTYHFSVDGVPFDGFNQTSPDQATIDFRKQMKAIGANDRQILVTSELLAQTTGNFMWNQLIAEKKLFRMTADEIKISGLNIDNGEGYFLPGTPIQEKFVTAKYGLEMHVELHIFTERLNRLGVAGDAVSTDPAKTHCLTRMSISVDIEGNILIEDIEARFSRKVLGGADDIE